MIWGGNADNVENRERVRRDILADFRCTHCHPHRGENWGAYGARPHGRWVDSTFVPSKPKESK